MSDARDGPGTSWTDPLPAARALAAAANDLEVLEPETRIEAFTIVREIGRGSTGVVFEARQDPPLDRRVALKVLRLSALSPRSIERFLREQRLMARVTHAGVAQVLGTGVLEDGRPWFAMELVDGAPIDVFCRSRALSLESRLHLLADACDAVAFAHRKGVVHRDLKPGNVLVSDADGSASVKIVDFGVSRALDPGTPTGGDSSFPLTETGQLVGTIEFMSPEVAERGAEASSPLGDVYALGALAYCTLAGGLPVDPGDARITPLDERLRRIRLEPARRASEVAKFHPNNAVPHRLLRRDADAVLARSVAKKPDARQPGAETLAADLRMLARGEPVPMPDLPLMARVRNTWRMHRTPISVLATIATALGIAATLALRAARIEATARSDAERALAEARAANARTEQVVLGLWQAIGPVRNRIQYGADSPHNVGMMGAVRDLFVQVFGADHPRTDTAVREYARALASAGRLQEAAGIFLAALPGWEARGGADHPKLVSIRTEIAECLRRAGQPSRALPLYQAVLRQSDEMGPPFESPVQAARRGMSIALSDLGHHEDAIAVAEDGLRRLTLMPPPHAMDRAFLEGVRASAYRFAGRLPEAEALYRALLEPGLQAAIRAHPQARLSTGAWAGELGMLLQADGRREEARPWIEMGLRLLRDEASPANPTARWLRENAGCYGLCDDGSSVPPELAEQVDP